MKEIKEEDLKYGLSDEDYYAVVQANVERHRNARQDKKKRINIPIKPLSILLAIGAVIGAVIFSFSDFFVIDNFEIKGNKYFSAEEIITMSHASPGSNIIYSPGKKEIVNYLEENTYIKSAKVTRKFPSTLVITVEERTQLVALAYDNEYLILDSEGVFLRKTRSDPKLTIVSGIKVDKLELGKEISTKNEQLFENAMQIVNTMVKQDLYFVRIDMEEMYINAYIYDSLVCKGTTEQIVEGMESGRLHTILETLFAKGIKRGTITFTEDGYASFQPTIS